MQCPDKTLVAQFVEGQLSAELLSRFEAHLDQCDSCLGIIAEAAAESTASLSEVDPPAPQSDSVFVHLVAALARRSDRSPRVDVPAARDQFGPYRVVAPIGRGAMGLVYEAVGPAGQRVAIKTVAGINPSVLAAMRQEIAFLEKQRHPGVVSIFDSGVVDSDPWYAMELLDGQTLEAFNRTAWTAVAPGAGSARPLAAGGRLDEVIALFARVCDPLAFVHRAGIVHCDLKPANVFVRRDGRPVLVDFGLLSRAGGAIGRESLEVGGKLRGTLPYIAPELVRGNIPDARADLYALGCMLYESVTGHPPFSGRTAREYLEAHLGAQPVPASDAVTGVPRALDALIARLLAKRPDQRIGDAAVVADLLLELTQTPQTLRAPSVPSAPYLFRPRLVGRDAVVDQVQALRAAAERGQGRLVLVGGESGIGKTFLASEIGQRAARAGFEVITGECTPVAPTSQAGQEIVAGALEPFRKLLQHAADWCRDPERGSAMRLFGSERSLRLLARYEPALRHLVDAGATDDFAALPPMAERERVLQALTDLLARMAEDRPLLLIVDDLQWADDLSLALLTSLSLGALVAKRVLVMALFRSEETSPAIAALEQKEGVTSIRLDRLDAGALSVLVGDLLSGRPPARFVETLATQSEGNPFFVAEYLRAAATEGLLDRTAEGWMLSTRATQAPRGDAVLALPPGLQALLERRLGALTEVTQRVTEAAAVLGREFRVEMLSPVAATPGDAVARAVDEMILRQVVQQVSPGHLRFLHDKTREAAYARLERGRRTTLHREAARVIEEAHAGGAELPEHYAELAYHLRRAGEVARAVDYFEKAGTHALQGSANADAVRLFREAVQLVGASSVPVPSERRASWERMIGDALYGLGHLEQAKEPLLAAAALLGWPMPARPAVTGLAIAPQMLRQVFHRTAKRRWIEVDPRRAASHLEAGRAYDRLQQIYYYRGEYLPLFLANLTTLNLVERAPPSPLLAAAYANAAAAAGIVPARGVAVRYFALAEATLGTAYDPEVESYLRLLHAVYLTGLGEWTRAIGEATRALELAGQLGFRRRWEEAAGVRCGATSDFDERIAWSRRVVESARRRDDPQTTTWSLMNQAEVFAARGDFSVASDLVAEVEAMLPRLGAPEQTQALGMRSFLRLAEGNTTEAGAVADRAAALVKQTQPIHVGSIDTYTRIAHVQLALWAAGPKGRAGAERRAKAERACADLGAASRIFPGAAPSFCLQDGTRRWIAGDRRRALATWGRGLYEARRLGLPYREAQLLRMMSRGVPQASGDARDARERSDHLAAGLGVRDDALLVVDTGHSAE